MIKLSYTYKGRPLAPYGKTSGGKSSLPGMSGDREKRFRLMKWFFFVGALLVILCAGYYLLRSTRYAGLGAASSVPVMESEGAPVELAVFPETEPGAESPSEDEPALPASSGVTEPSSEAGTAETSVPGKEEALTRGNPVSEERSRQALEVYSAAAKAYRDGKYEDARRALQLYFERLNMPPSHMLYAKACDMLGDCSMRIYRSGNDSSAFLNYEVRSGDSLSFLAKKFGTSVGAIRETNHLKSNSLQIGQKLKIPQSAWRIVVDRTNERILLFGNGRLFKIYPMRTGLRGRGAAPGIYQIRTKQKNPSWNVRGKVYASGAPENPLGGRWLALGANRQGIGVLGIHGRGGSSGKDSNTGFSLAKEDILEFFDLVPEGTAVEIIN